VLEIKCECGKKVYATAVTYHGLQIQDLTEIIHTMRLSASQSRENAEAPRIWETTRRMHYRLGESYDELADKLEEIKQKSPSFFGVKNMSEFNCEATKKVILHQLKDGEITKKQAEKAIKEVEKHREYFRKVGM